MRETRLWHFWFFMWSLHWALFRGFSDLWFIFSQHISNVKWNLIPSIVKSMHIKIKLCQWDIVYNTWLILEWQKWKEQSVFLWKLKNNTKLFLLHKNCKTTICQEKQQEGQVVRNIQQNYFQDGMIVFTAKNLQTKEAKPKLIEASNYSPMSWQDLQQVEASVKGLTEPYYNSLLDSYCIGYDYISLLRGYITLFIQFIESIWEMPIQLWWSW